MHQLLPLCILLYLWRFSESASGSADTPAHPMFYIYSWSDSIINSFPVAYSHRRQHITEEFAQNYGVGPVIDERLGLYHTHQYSLFATFLARLEESPYRTLDPEKASLFFIPYDVGMDASARQSDGALIKTGCPRSQKVLPLLSNSPYFFKHGGADHFLLHSINQPMLFFMPDQCRTIYEICLKCTKLCIDTYDPQMYRELRVYPEMSTNWISVPFPSNHHYSSTSQAALEAPISSTELERWYDLVYIGTDHVSAKHNKLMRGILRRQCMRATDPVFITSSSEIDGGLGRRSAASASASASASAIASDTDASKNNQQQPRADAQSSELADQDMYREKDKRSACWLGLLGSHASETQHLFAKGHRKEKIDGKGNAAWTAGIARTGPAAEPVAGKEKKGGVSPYCHGRLCLMPGGDFPTRKAVLDAMLCGCVPVTFQRVTAQEQWPWHWVSKSGKSLADDATIFINREEFIKSPSEQFASLLRLARNATFMEEKRLALQEIRSQMQYRLPNGYPPGDTTAKKDAVDVILENLFAALPDPF